MTEKTASRIQVLDGFRAVAILLVLGFHYGVRWSPPWSNDHLVPFGDMFAGIDILKYGKSHACFFFILSGFVILLTLDRCSSFPEFMRKRLARLWPALILCALTTTALVAIFGPGGWLRGPVSIVSSILFIDPKLLSPLLPGQQLGWVDGAYWTLGVEMRFYLLTGLLFLIGRSRFLPAWMVLQVVSFFLGAPFVAPEGQLWVVRGIALSTYLPYFTLGICLYEIYRTKSWKGLPAWGGAMAAAMIMVNAGWWTHFTLEDPIGRLWVNAGWIVVFTLFVVDSPVVRPFGWAPLAALGEASYALFLLHEAAGIALMRGLDRAGLNPLVNLAVVILAMIGASLLIYRRLENPARDLIMKASAPLQHWLEAQASWLNYRRPLTQPHSVATR